jgi:hypothetical protein
MTGSGRGEGQGKLLAAYLPVLSFGGESKLLGTGAQARRSCRLGGP